jgi:hypothetical protein
VRFACLLPLLACSPLAGGAGGGRDSEGRDTAGGSVTDTHETACEEHTAAVAECTDRLGAAEAVRHVVESREDLDALVTTSPTVLASGEALAAYWESAGLAAAGEPLPEVDFATEQVVAYAHDAVSCHSSSRVEGFCAALGNPSALVARLDVELLCERCDTGARWVLDVWVTRAGALSSCRAGTECVSCP